MKTPICDFINAYAKSGDVRLHMPGHKGKNFLGVEKYDITEIEGADVLSKASGIIAQSEENATLLFGSKSTFYSTEGSSLCIKAMLTLAARGKEKPYFIAGRNVHKSFVYACAMLDAEVEWIYSTSHLCSCEISDLYLEKMLKNSKREVDGVFITSPDYLGQTVDIASISRVCKEYGVPLLVDNAHGAYLRFLKEDTHPISLGADICCDSAHKTLPTLTGGAYLHFSKNVKDEWVEKARSAMSLYASTSPSYLILQSLDLTNAYLSDNKAEYEVCAKRVDALKESLVAHGVAVQESERLKLVIYALKNGYTGEQIAQRLAQNGIQVEFFDREYLVCMFSPQNGEDDYARVEKTLLEMEIRKEIPSGKFGLKPEIATSIRKAVLAKSEAVAVKDAIGRILAAPTVSCPPAVPVVVSGEMIDEACAVALEYYGVEQIEVIKE